MRCKPPHTPHASESKHPCVGHTNPHRNRHHTRHLPPRSSRHLGQNREPLTRSEATEGRCQLVSLIHGCRVID